MENDILSLRRAGRIEQGIVIGEQMLATQQADIWACRGLFWCYYDKAKQLADNGASVEARIVIQKMSSLVGRLDGDERAIECLERIKRTILPEYAIILQATNISKNISKEEGREIEAYNLISPLFDTVHESLHEDLGWVLYRYIKSQLDILPSVEIRRLLARYMKLSNPRPSMLHSTVLQLALSFAKTHDDFIFYRFFELWNPKNLRQEDYQSTFRDGQSYNPFVERIVSQIADSNAPYTPQELHYKLRSNRITLARVVTLYRERIFWKLNAISQSGNKCQLWAVLNEYVSKYGQYPGDEFHSKILSIAIRNADEIFKSALIPFAIKWGLSNFRDEDWQPEIGRDGNEYPSLASKILSSIHEWFKDESNRSEEVISEFLPIFKEGSRRLTADHWPKYRYAKMLLWNGDKSEALSVLKSLSTHLSPQSYYWQCMAEAVDEVQAKCDLNLKAISLQRDENLLRDTRLDVAKLLIDLGQPAHAKIELCRYQTFRNSEGKSVNAAFHQLWAIVEDCVEDERIFNEFVKERCEIAEEILFEDLPWEEAVIADFWTHENGKEFISFVTPAGESYNVSKSKFRSIRNSKRGKVVYLRIERQNPSKPAIVMVRLSDKERWGILPEKVGVVNHRNEHGAVFVYMPESVNSVKIENANSRIQVGTGVSFRLLKKNHNGKMHMTAESISIISGEEWKKQFPKAQVAVDNVNSQKRLHHFIGLSRLDGIIRFKGGDAEFKVGDGLEITYFRKANREGKILIETIDCKKMPSPLPNLVKRVSGWISVPTDRHGNERNFGFLENCFISPDLLGQAPDGTRAEGRAILTKDGEWRVFELELEDDCMDFEDEPHEELDFKGVVMDMVKSYYMIGLYRRNGQEGYFEDLRDRHGQKIKDLEGNPIKKIVPVLDCNLVENEFYEFMWEVEGDSIANYNFVCLGNIRPVDKIKLLEKLLSNTHRGG